MSDLISNISNVIRRQFNQSDFEIVGLIPLPAHNDRMVRLQLLQEILEDSGDSNSHGALEYLLQVKPKTLPVTSQKPDEAKSSSANPINIYLGNGKLNIP